MSFKDLFSKQSQVYNQYRPQYPDDLFRYLAELAPERKCAWDCATGNGQAALSLAAYFDSVRASDASETQIALASPRENISYFTAPAECSGLDQDSIDLITVANAIHWFDLEPFFDEAFRVLKPGGILSFWCYETISGGSGIEGLKKIFAPVYDKIRPYWQANLSLVWDHYRTIGIPQDKFEEVPTQGFSMKLEWSLEQYLGFMRSWSAYESYINDRGEDPLNGCSEQLKSAWGEPGSTKEIDWLIHLRAARLLADRK